MGSDPLAEAAGGGNEFGVSAWTTKEASEKSREKGVTGANGVHHRDGLRGNPSPAIGAKETGAAGARGDANGGHAELGRKGAGVGFFAAGRFGRVRDKPRGFGRVEFEDVGERSETADQREVVVRRAEIYVEDAQSGGRQCSGEFDQRLAVFDGAERE